MLQGPEGQHTSVCLDVVLCVHNFGICRVWLPSSLHAAPTRRTDDAPAIPWHDSDHTFAECCLGTMTWGKQNTEAEAHEQLSYAFDQGVNFMDAAEMYPVPTEAETQGLTEKYIGSWLKSQKRDDIVIASKVDSQHPPLAIRTSFVLSCQSWQYTTCYTRAQGPSGRVPVCCDVGQHVQVAGYSDRISWLREEGAPTRVNKEQIQIAIDGILERLGVDCIELLQVHWPDRYVPLFGQAGYDPTQCREYVPFEEQLEGLQSVIKQGKVSLLLAASPVEQHPASCIHAPLQLPEYRVVCRRSADGMCPCAADLHVLAA